MNQSNQIQQSTDEIEVKPRDCDDMLARRLTGNNPGHTKRTSTMSFNQFITPTGNPKNYIRIHKKNNETNDTQNEKLEKEREQDDRNQRYEKMESLKQMLKSEEDLWSSKLDDWKAKRRSLTFDVRQRKEDRESILQHASSTTAPLRRSKTYREILEEKKKRDSGLYFHDDYTFPNEENDYEAIFASESTNKNSVTVPSLKIINKEGERQDGAAVSGVEVPEKKNNSNPLTPSGALSKNTKELFPSAAPVTSDNDQYVDLDAVGKLSVVEMTQPRRSSFSSQPKLDNGETKQLDINVTTGQSSSGRGSVKNEFPEPCAAVANRRSIYENLAAMRREMNAPRPTRVDLSSLLQKDVDRLQTNGTFPEPTNGDAASTSLSSSDPGFDLPFEQVSATQDRSPVHQPKIMNANQSANRAFLPPSLLNSQHSKNTFEPIHKYGNPAAIRPPLAKAATLPSRLRIGLVEEKADKVKAQDQQNSLQLNFSGLKGTGFSPRRSPRSGPGAVDSLFEDLDISISQRPKCEKGFGFTVRGGDDGRPVVVNQVSPGGAAELSHLCVGDEILAINGVRLSSSLTQDNIVQLIVESVIKGNLLLGIRRYGKSKKVNTPRWLGTSLLGSPRGFYPRPDSSPLNFANQKPTNKSPVQESRGFPFSGYHQPSSTSSSKPSHPNSAESSFPRSAIPSVDTLANGKPQENGFATGRENTIDGLNYQGHKEEPFALEQDRAKREEEKRKRIEAAKAEEQKIADELRKIELAKEQQKREREERKRNLLFSAPSFLTNGVISYGDKKHWLIEEAERSRLAAKAGKPRINIVEFTRENNPAFGRNQS